MSIKPTRLALAFASLALFATTSARADVPPPDDYEETCTVDKQTVPGLTCEACSAWHGERDACDKTLGVKGMRRMCKSWGASSWSEVWCSGTPTDPKPAETPGTSTSDAKKTGCGATPDPGLVVGVLALFGLVAVRAPSLRRRRERVR